MKIIINGDDFGLNHAINKGIIDAYQYGLLTSASLMVNYQSSVQAAKLALMHPGLRLAYISTSPMVIVLPQKVK